MSSFPLLAGRVVRPDTPDAPWKVRLLFASPLTRADHGMQVRLTNSGVPVSFIDSDADGIFPTDLTAQSFDHLVGPQNAERVTSREGDQDKPLFRLMFTRFTKLNSTSIQVLASHVLCTFSPDLPSPSCCADGYDSSRWVQQHAISQTTLSAIPRPRTARSPAVLRTGSDQVHRITGDPSPNSSPQRPVSPIVATARKDGDGIRRVRVDSETTHRDTQCCSEGYGTPEDVEGGSGGRIACTVLVRGRT